MSGSGIPTTGRRPVTDVDEHLAGDEPGGAHSHQASDRLTCGRGDVEAAHEEQAVTQQQHQAADEPPRLGEHGEDEIRMTLRQEGQTALRRASDALPEELTRTNRDLGLDDVVRAPERIAERIQVHEDALALVVLEDHPGNRQRPESSGDERAEELETDASAYEQDEQHRKEQERRAEVGLLDHQHEGHGDHR
jgi:hypothetical protein